MNNFRLPILEIKEEEKDWPSIDKSHNWGVAIFISHYVEFKDSNGQKIGHRFDRQKGYIFTSKTKQECEEYINEFQEKEKV